MSDKPFFYGYVSEQANTYRKLVKSTLKKYEHLKPGEQEITRRGLNNLTKEIRAYEKAVVIDLESALVKEDIDLFSSQFDGILGMRQGLLKSYVNDRLKQEQEAFSNSKLERYVLIRSMNSKTKELYKDLVSVSEYVFDNDIITLIKDKPEVYLPSVDKTDLDNIVIVGTHNISKIVCKNKKKCDNSYIGKIGKDKSDVYFEIHSRLKRSERELQKFVDTLTGIRAEWPFDAIATHEIFSNPVTFYEGLNRIVSLNKKCSKHKFKIDYRNVPGLDDFNGKDSGNGKSKKKVDVDNVFEKLKQQNNDLVIKIKKGKVVTKDDAKALLSGAWVDHHPKTMRMETIVMVPEFYDWYTGPIGHDSNFIERRRELRNFDLEKNCLLNITNYLENKFNDLFDSKLF